MKTFYRVKDACGNVVFDTTPGDQFASYEAREAITALGKAGYRVYRVTRKPKVKAADASPQPWTLDAADWPIVINEGDTVIAQIPAPNYTMHEGAKSDALCDKAHANARLLRAAKEMRAEIADLIAWFDYAKDDFGMARLHSVALDKLRPFIVDMDKP